MKVDLVMWSKHGPRESVLKRISDVIPEQNVNQRFLVVDSLSDIKETSYTRYQWALVLNEGKFISGAANTALRQVKTEFFVSFEDDILLANDWWEKIPKYMKDENVLTAQGIRVYTDPTLRHINEYVFRRDHRKGRGQSPDNNIFRTSLLKKLGGFPNTDPMNVDGPLAVIAENANCKWILDENVVSWHIRRGVRQGVKHEYEYNAMRKKAGVPVFEDMKFSTEVRSVLTSLLSGVRMAVAEHDSNIVWAYPYSRFYELKTFIHERRVKLHFELKKE